MRPRFRTDLTCSREEQQGVVFYRVDDPKTQTSFRLYEIEYLIAQRLDGERDLAAVIAAVKSEYNFDISEPDLTKFVSQLDSMGFIEKDAGQEVSPDSETRVMERPAPEVEAGGEQYLEADLLDASPASVDEAELRRLLKSALLHVRQGYIVHARDYFLAAKELSPNDSRLSRLVSHLEIIGDSSGPAEVDYLWNQARELFPELAEEVAPAGETPLSGGGGLSDSSQDTPRRDDDLRSRLFWLAILVVLVGGVGGALYYFASKNRLFEGAAKVTVAVIKAQRLPLYHDKPAVQVRAAREVWLQIPSAGKVDLVSTKVGERVQAEQVLLSMVMPPALQKQIDAANANVKKAVESWDKTTAKVAVMRQERDAVQAERNEAERKLTEPKSKASGPQARVQKRDLAKWKKVKAKTTRKLAQLGKRLRGPEQQESKAKLALEQTRQRVAELEKQLGSKQVRAPFAGVVVQVAVDKGKAVNKDDKAVLLRDNMLAYLTFLVGGAGVPAVDSEVFVTVSRGAPSRAKVTAVTPTAAGTRVEVAIVDPAGAFVDMRPEEFRLVREFVDRAFEVPISGMARDARGAHVLVELQGRALARDVEVLTQDKLVALVRDKSGMLRDGDHVITDRVGAEGGASTIADGSFVDVQ